jgi:hypothetical protein
MFLGCSVQVDRGGTGGKLCSEDAVRLQRGNRRCMYVSVCGLTMMDARGDVLPDFAHGWWWREISAGRETWGEEAVAATLLEDLGVGSELERWGHL